MIGIRTIEWVDGRVRIIDQTRLPGEVGYLDLADVDELVEAIQSLRVRGAPALGVAGAMGVALAARGIQAPDRESFLRALQPAADRLASARPTAVNLSWGVQRLMQKAAASHFREPQKIAAMLQAEAQRVLDEDVAANRALGRLGAALLPDDATVLTHCNAGALATGGYGTALGVLRAAQEAGKRVRVYVDETRPLLQGSRLTAWELMQDGFDVTLIADNMAGHFLYTGGIACVIVGADRIAANGDVANKIGTYSVAVLAKENGVPFYVAAPVSTVDLSLPGGEDIPIEERRGDEVSYVGGVRLAPEGVKVANPAFDVTPARYVTAIITDRGVVRAPYGPGLRAVCGQRG